MTPRPLNELVNALWAGAGDRLSHDETRFVVDALRRDSGLHGTTSSLSSLLARVASVAARQMDAEARYFDPNADEQELIRLWLDTRGRPENPELVLLVPKGTLENFDVLPPWIQLVDVTPGSIDGPIVLRRERNDDATADEEPVDATIYRGRLAPIHGMDVNLGPGNPVATPRRRAADSFNARVGIGGFPGGTKLPDEPHSGRGPEQQTDVEGFGPDVHPGPPPFTPLSDALGELLELQRAYERVLEASRGIDLDGAEARLSAFAEGLDVARKILLEIASNG